MTNTKSLPLGLIDQILDELDEHDNNIIYHLLRNLIKPHKQQRNACFLEANHDPNHVTAYKINEIPTNYQSTQNDDLLHFIMSNITESHANAFTPSQFGHVILWAIAEGYLTNLQEITFENAKESLKYIDNEVYKGTIAQRMVEMKELHTVSVSGIGPLPNLRKIFVECNNCNHGDHSHYDASPTQQNHPYLNLKTLKLEGPLGYQGLKSAIIILPYLPNLTTLDLQYNHFIGQTEEDDEENDDDDDNEAMSMIIYWTRLTAMPLLTDLNISFNNFTSLSSIKMFAKSDLLSRLQIFSFRNSTFNHPNQEKMIDILINSPSFSSNNNITHLELPLPALNQSHLIQLFTQTPGLCNLTYLSTPFTYSFDDSVAEALATSPYITKLTNLIIGQSEKNSESTQVLGTLAKSPNMTHIRELSFGKGEYNAWGFYIWGKSPYLTNVTSLFLHPSPNGFVDPDVHFLDEDGENYTEDEDTMQRRADNDMKVFFHSKNVQNFESLSLSQCDLSTDMIISIATSPYLYNLKSLDLTASLRPNANPDIFLPILFNSPNLQNLQTLFLSGWETINDEHLDYIINSPYLDNITMFDLSSCGISPDGFELLKESRNMLYEQIHHDS